MMKANSIRRMVSLILGAAVLTTAMAFAQGTPRKDFQIALDIYNAVINYDRYTIFDDVTANVKDGAATLTGKVRLADIKNEIEKRVKKVKGVTVVRNQIEVLPPSKFDDELRSRVANAIYNNSNFWQYASMQNPPIHILVEGSNVTLAGTVRSDLDKKLAQSLAMQAGAGNLTNKLLTEAEARQTMER